ncbi:radical SAM protein [Desulfovibrio sp. X2]|uniref:radical SAM protein n=1 Tax=Desulfovibrio sp. X2 TaxID=941449 RepID=UPI0003FDC78D|nr:radical SAM protein [Desulfovibrio sp. X2]
MKGAPLLPVFLPHAGCPARGEERCVFCDQRIQTGCGEAGCGADGGVEEPGGAELAAALDALRSTLAQRMEQGAPPVEVGFYGGTFTALPGDWPERFVRLAAGFREQGAVVAVRCSTRPDACAPGLLARLAGLGLETVEVGVQSFSDEALAACRRGYDGETAVAGCRAVRAAGLRLGVHLMPGLPCGSLRGFLSDAARCVELRAHSVRLHPCLALSGTPLARMHARGAFTPWPLAKALAACGTAVARLWEADVRVIRLGLTPEPALLAAIAAGPWHPAFGQRVRGRALYLHVASRVAAHVRAGLPRPDTLLVPSRHLADVIGWRRETAPRYAGLGLSVREHAENFFLLVRG